MIECSLPLSFCLVPLGRQCYFRNHKKSCRNGTSCEVVKTCENGSYCYSLYNNKTSQVLVGLSFCLPVWLSLCLLVCLSICLPVYPSACQSFRQSVSLPVCLVPVYLPVCLSVCLSASLVLLAS